MTAERSMRSKIVRHTAAELKAMKARGECKTDWKAAAQKPLPSGEDPDDAMEDAGWVTTKMPRPGKNRIMVLLSP